MFFFFPFQGSSEAEPLLQAEEAPALTAPPTGALHLPHQLQWHPAGLAASCPAMPAPSCVQSEREPRDGKGENRPVHTTDSSTENVQQIHTGCAHACPHNPYTTHLYTTTHTTIQICTDPYLKGRMQSGDTVVHEQRAVWSSPCRCSQISLLECHEFI